MTDTSQTPIAPIPPVETPPSASPDDSSGDWQWQVLAKKAATFGAIYGASVLSSPAATTLIDDFNLVAAKLSPYVTLHVDAVAVSKIDSTTLFKLIVAIAVLAAHDWVKLKKKYPWL